MGGGGEEPHAERVLTSLARIHRRSAVERTRRVTSRAFEEPAVVLSTGAVLQSRRGRTLAPVPLVETTTADEKQASLARLTEWMLAEARLEGADKPAFLAFLDEIEALDVDVHTLRALGLVLFGAPVRTVGVDLSIAVG